MHRLWILLHIAAGSWLKFKKKKKIQKMVHNNKRSAITNRKYVFVILRKSMKNQLILAANKKNLTKILQKLFKSPTIMIPNQPLKNSSISRMDFMDLNQTSKLMRVKQQLILCMIRIWYHWKVSLYYILKKIVKSRYVMNDDSKIHWHPFLSRLGFKIGY